MARTEESITTPTDDEERSALWGWAAATLIILVTSVVFMGAVLLTPGSPSSCNIPNLGGWFLCGWARKFVANAVVLTLVLVGITVPLALVVGMTRALVCAARD